MPRDYNIPTSDTAGSMTLEDLLPNIDFSKYDMTDFEDIIPEFSTALLDITKAQGKESIAGAISGGQEAFMQTPTTSAVAGAGGFGGAGGGGRGLIGYESAQRGMFGDVFGAMLGAERAEISELDRMKKEAAGFFSEIRGDLGKEEGDDGTYTPPGVSVPSTGPVAGTGYQGEGGQTWYWSESQGWYTINQQGEVTTAYNTLCFTGDTRIITINGSKTIESINRDDIVMTFDLRKNELKKSVVTKTFKHKNPHGYIVINNILKTTPNHPFYSNGGWKEAGKLVIGDKILHVDGVEHKIDSIDKVNGKIDVYNIEVDDTHNYFAEGYLVHNK